MTQAVPEVKNPNQEPPETIEANGNGVPSNGHEEGIPNNTAEVAVAETIEEQTGDINTGEQEILEDPNIKAEPSAEHAVSEIHPDVAAAGIQVISPESESKTLDTDAKALGGAVVGAEAPSHNLGQTVGEFNPRVVPAHDPTDTRVFPPVFETGAYANPENNGLPLHRLALKRISELLFGKGKLIAGSQKDNISQFPAQKQQEVKKAA